MYAVKLLCVVKCFHEKLENQIFAAHPQTCAIYVAHSTKKVPPPRKRKKEMDILFYHDVLVFPEKKLKEMAEIRPSPQNGSG